MAFDVSVLDHGHLSSSLRGKLEVEPELSRGSLLLTNSADLSLDDSVVSSDNSLVLSDDVLVELSLVGLGSEDSPLGSAGRSLLIAIELLGGRA